MSKERREAVIGGEQQLQRVTNSDNLAQSQVNKLNAPQHHDLEVRVRRWQRQEEREQGPKIRWVIRMITIMHD